MKKLKANNERKENGLRNFDPKAKPIRFKRLTLETEDGLIFQVPGLQIKEMTVVTPLEMRDGKSIEEGFIKSVGPQEVTIVFQTFGINWPNPKRYPIEEIEREVKNLTPKPLQLPEHNEK